VSEKLAMPARSREAMMLGIIDWQAAVVEVHEGRIGFVGRDFLPIPPSE
jgi:hypothetical protein